MAEDMAKVDRVAWFTDEIQRRIADGQITDESDFDIVVKCDPVEVPSGTDMWVYRPGTIIVTTIRIETPNRKDYP